MKPVMTIMDQHLKIHIDGILHLCVAVPNISWIQSYQSSSLDFVIEIGVKEGVTIELNYVNRHMWECILKQLDTLKLY